MEETFEFMAFNTEIFSKFFFVNINFCSGREYGNKENLKEMGDVSSGMASTVIQVYLKAILESFINPDMVSLLKIFFFGQTFLNVWT